MEIAGKRNKWLWAKHRRCILRAIRGKGMVVIAIIRWDERVWTVLGRFGVFPEVLQSICLAFGCTQALGESTDCPCGIKISGMLGWELRADGTNIDKYKVSMVFYSSPLGLLVTPTPHSDIRISLLTRDSGLLIGYHRAY